MKEEKSSKQIKGIKEIIETEEKNKWGETVEGIIKILESVNEVQEEFSYFDPFLSESIKSIEKFVYEYIPKENIEIKDVELLENLDKMGTNYLKTGFFISKMFLENLFTREQMQDFQGFIKKLCQFRDEIQEFATLCDIQNSDSETNKIIKKHKKAEIFRIIEETKSRCLLLGVVPSSERPGAN